MVSGTYGTLSEADDEHSNGFSYHQYHQHRNSKLWIHVFSMKLEWIFILTNIILEILVLIFDQMASPHNPKYGLIVWELSLAVMLVCVAELVCRGLVKEKLTLMQCLKSLLPCSSEKRIYSFMDGVILIGAKVQMALASIAYGYLLLGKQTPIKVSLLTSIFIVCFVIYKVVKSHRNEGHLLLPVRQEN